ncbi:MAG: hypothetical protein GF414_04580, partial [Candidatus Altiarchaeales archaeon]|nr:hypothetical protein [Candidatus Altiarchaeales archaeon]
MREMQPMDSLSLCNDCPFRGKKVPSKGDPTKCKYVLVGEAPGAHEIRKGEPFVGPTGQLLEGFLQEIGVDLRTDDFYLMNAISCRVRNKNKVPKAVRSCRPRVLAELEQVNDDAIIVLMGVNARESVFPGEPGGILSARGWREWNGHDMYVMAHPSYYLYNTYQAPMLLKDVQRFTRGRLPQIGPFEILELRPFYPAVIRDEDDDSYRAYVLDTYEKLEWFGDMLHKYALDIPFLAFDLETDQVDFQRDRILCMSISTSPGRAFIIPDSLLYDDGHEHVTTGWSKEMWRKFLHDDRYRTASYLKTDPYTK